MKNPFKKTPTQEKVAVPFTSLLRSLIYDSGLHSEGPEEVIAAMGLNPASDEVSEMERDLSNRRVECLEPISEYLAATVKLMAGALTQHVALHDDDADDESLARMAENFAAVLSAGIVACVSNAVALGLLDIAGETLSDV